MSNDPSQFYYEGSARAWYPGPAPTDESPHYNCGVNLITPPPPTADVNMSRSSTSDTTNDVKMSRAPTFEESTEAVPYPDRPSTDCCCSAASDKLPVISSEHSREPSLGTPLSYFGAPGLRPRSKRPHSSRKKVRSRECSTTRSNTRIHPTQERRSFHHPTPRKLVPSQKPASALLNLLRDLYTWARHLLQTIRLKVQHQWPQHPRFLDDIR